ncbi:hypothetical protein, partial [Vibrio brasiliensis]
EMAELVDAPDLGSGAARCESSSLSFRTILYKTQLLAGFCFIYSMENLVDERCREIKKSSRGWIFCLES